MASVMYNCDIMHGESSFHPEVLALNDKKYMREVTLERPAIGTKATMRPFWITDYPILCYVGHKQAPTSKVDKSLNVSQRLADSF